MNILPMTKTEMDSLGWEQCDIILVSGDAYVDHPSFGPAIIGRVLESQGFKVGIIANTDQKNFQGKWVIFNKSENQLKDGFDNWDDLVI